MQVCCRWKRSHTHARRHKASLHQTHTLSLFPHNTLSHRPCCVLTCSLSPWKTWWPWSCPTKNTQHVTTPFFVVYNCGNRFIQPLTVRYFNGGEKSTSLIWQSLVTQWLHKQFYIAFPNRTRPKLTIIKGHNYISLPFCSVSCFAV